MGRIFLIRHGEVEFNRENAYIGSTDLPLNFRGRVQAAEMAGYLEGRSISAVYSSNKTRARETAEILAQRFDLPVHPVGELAEVDYGEWEGVPEAEVPGLYPDIFPRWCSNPLEVRIPGGETFAELRDRAYPAFRRTAEAYPDENVAIVAHKSTNRVILCCVLGIDINLYRQIGQLNACVNMIEARRDGSFAVETINERCYLNKT